MDSYIPYSAELLVDNYVSEGCTNYNQLSTRKKQELAGCYLSNKLNVLHEQTQPIKDPEIKIAAFNQECDDLVDAMSFMDIRSIGPSLSQALYERGSTHQISSVTAVQFATQFCNEFIKYFHMDVDDLFNELVEDKCSHLPTEIDDLHAVDMIERIRDINHGLGESL